MSIKKYIISALIGVSMLINSTVFASDIELNSSVQKSAKISSNFAVNFSVNSDLTGTASAKQNALFVIASYPQPSNTMYVRNIIKDMAAKLLSSGAKNIAFVKYGESTVIEGFKPLTVDYLQNKISWRDQNGSGSEDYTDNHINDYNNRKEQQLHSDGSAEQNKIYGSIDDNINIDLGNLFVAGKNLVTDNYVNTIKDTSNTSTYFIFDGITGDTYLNKGSDYTSKVNTLNTNTSFPQSYTIATDAYLEGSYKDTTTEKHNIASIVTEMYKTGEDYVLKASTDTKYIKQTTGFKAASTSISFISNTLNLNNASTKCLYVNTQDNSGDFKMSLVYDPNLTKQKAKDTTYQLPTAAVLPFSFVDPTKDTTAALTNLMNLNNGTLKLEQSIPANFVVTDTSGVWKKQDGSSASNAVGPITVYRDITGNLTSQDFGINLRGNKVGIYQIPYKLWYTDSTGTQVIKTGSNDIVIKDDVLAKFANKNIISIKKDAVGTIPINVNTKTQNAKNIIITMSTANGIIFTPLGPTTKGVKYSYYTDLVSKKVTITITPSDQYLNGTQTVLYLQYKVSYADSSAKYKTDTLKIEDVTYTLEGLTDTEDTIINDAKKITSYGKIKLR